jgi:putative DNA primase/helicase
MPRKSAAVKVPIAPSTDAIPSQNPLIAPTTAPPVGNPDVDAAYRTLSQYHPSEKGNVLFMASKWRDRLRYDPILNIWLQKLPSGVWKEDLTQSCAYQALDEAAVARRAFALQIPDEHPDIRYRDLRRKQLAWSHKNEEFRILQASVRWAEKTKIFTVSPDLWDRDPYAIGTPTGIYDLRTGLSRIPDSESYISKSTNVTPGHEHAECPLWLDFLSKAMRQDGEKIAYLKRLAGYSLTGSVREQSLTWFVGGGGNGKGTFLDALTAIYGDYAHPMRTEPLMMAKHDQHPTEICDLKGRRLVIASETDEGRTWRESLLKRLTGGDPITARRMHSDPITFLPTHTLIVSCNSQPALSSVGEAERRRFQILNWEATFKFADDPTFTQGDIVRDALFNSKLESEYPAILRWAMDGAREWMDKGLSPPASVVAYSQEYLDEQDFTQQWLDHLGERREGAWTSNDALWQAWYAWCMARGVEPGKNTGLTQRLHRKGFVSQRDGSGNRGIAGLSLKPSDLTLNESVGSVN